MAARRTTAPPVALMFRRLTDPTGLGNPNHEGRGSTAVKLTWALAPLYVLPRLLRLMTQSLAVSPTAVRGCVWAGTTKLRLRMVWGSGSILWIKRTAFTWNLAKTDLQRTLRSVSTIAHARSPSSWKTVNRRANRM